jgi:hypothetical protein
MLQRQPVRIVRTRKTFNVTPHGARYIGRPTLWANAFSRPGIGHAKSVILYDNWLQGHVNGPVLRRLCFTEDEINAMARWRARLMPRIVELRGFDLQDWCPKTSSWCHGNTLLRLANGPISALERTAA